MKNKKIKNLSVALFLLLLFVPVAMYAQGGQEQQLLTAIKSYQDTAKKIAKAVIALAAVGGIVLVYFKLQNDDGSVGKKAVMGFVGALVFAAVAWYAVEYFLS